MRPVERPIDFGNKLFNRVLLDESKLRSGNYWAELRVFLAVAKAKSFNRAGEMLGMSSMTVSRRVHRLQDVMQTVLFSSGVSGVQLTRSGLDLAVQLARLDIMLVDITQNLMETADAATGEVRVSITDGLAICVFGGAITRISEEHPGIKITLHTPNNIQDIRKNTTDILLSLTEDDGPDVVCTQLGTLHLVPVAATDYIQEYGQPSLENIEDHVFLNSTLYDPSNSFWRPWTDLTQRGRIAHSIENSIIYLSLAKRGLGISLLSNMVTLVPSLTHVDLGIDFRLPVYGVAHTESLDHPAKKLVFKYLCEFFSEENPWLRKELTFGHAPSIYDESFRFAFNL
ncbi:MAG: LysR family transcriptional regulator [Rhodobacteraceae bacterium]|nr:LysR family transcriptional regulator [Paracoccaceae bacterium]